MSIYILKFFLASLIATSAMTIFSYLLARKKKLQFREPEILNKLISRAQFFKIKLEDNHPVGWIMHYGIGLVFTGIFIFLYNINFLRLTLIPVFLFGLGAGVIGILGWHFMLSLNANPPTLNIKAFYVQLLFAHVIFSLALMGSFYLLVI